MSNQRRFALIGRGFGSDGFDEYAQDLVGALFVDSSEINFTYTDATPSITAALIDASITFARLQNFDALSVLGRAANSSGVSDEIAAGANDRLLRRTSDTLNFGQLTAGMFPNTVVPDAALSSNVPLLNAANIFTANQTISNGSLLLTAAASSLVVGHSSNPFGGIAALGTGVGSFLTGARYTATASAAPTLQLIRSRNATIGSHTLVQDGDALGAFAAYGSDGAAYIQAASFTFEVDGTPGTNDMPGRIILRTTADGGTTPTERFRIASNGQITTASSAGFTIGGTGETLATFVDDGAVTLYHDNVSRIATSATGVDMVAGTFRLFGYTVATLPAGTVGQMAYVTDANAPAYRTAVAGGGAAKALVFYDGTNWLT